MEVKDKGCFFKIERPVYQIHEIDEAVKKSNLNISHCSFEELIDKKPEFNVKDTILSKIPMLQWLPNYNWKEDFIKDAVSGFTVAVMNIPQGMAYAMLANVPPVVGIYMAFLPVIIYAILGTSRHISIGSFAVVCLMVANVVNQYADSSSITSTSSDKSVSSSSIHYSTTEVATAVAFMAGIFQVVMCVSRLDIICALLSDTLVSGFTAGAAVHVLTSQIKDVFGFHISSHNEKFKIIYTYIDIFRNVDTINWAATIVSAITIFLLLVNNILLKPWVNKRCIVPVPIELIVILIGTIVSTYTDVSQTYKLKIVGHIPVGIPEPRAPPFALLPDIAVQSLIIAIVGYIISISMAMIFAQKLKYEINPNQELLAQGSANIVGSFFSCAPIAASLSRSAIQQTVGGKTQLAGIISSCILLCVLLWFGPFFEPLPCCILSSLIVVALQSLLFKIKELHQIWKLSMLDGIVWVITYLTVVLIEIDIGLLIGLLVSFISLFIQGMKPYTCLLGRVPGTDIYVDRTKYSETVDPNGMRIVHYAGGLNFANRGYFRNEIYKLLNMWPKEILAYQNASLEKNGVYSRHSVEKIRYIILDLSGFHYMDPSGAASLNDIASEFSNIGVTIYGAGTSENVYESFKTNGLMESNLFTLFPTIHDAVLYAEHKTSQ